MKKLHEHIFFQLVSWMIAYNTLGLITFIVLKHEQLTGNYTNEDLTYRDHVIWGSMGAIFISILMGSAEYYFERFQWCFNSFGGIILLKSILYVFLIMLAITIGALLATWLEESVQFWNFFLSYQFLTIFLMSVLTSIILNFTIQVNKKFGKGELWSVITGKYFNPKVEKCIFMFLDLRSSTQYAEQLGHIKYSQLIQRCFHYINSVVPDYKARLYQYVGDEVVLTWNWEDGLTDHRCLSFYFAFMGLIKSQSIKFQQDFGLIPEFKAGTHGGVVTVAEVGDIKREIAYHGDVINSAARIQAKCNDFQKTLLISSFIMENLSNTPYKVERIGEVELRGIQQLMDIYAIETSHVLVQS